MYLIAIGWIYVVLMMSLAEAMHPTGTVLGAALTFLMYGVAPVSLVIYLLGGKFRRRARAQAEAADAAAVAQGHATEVTSALTVEPDSHGHAAGAGLTAERKEP